MAIQLIPRDRGLGTVLGEGLGSGLQQGIQGVLAQRLQNLQAETRRQSFEKAGIPGYLSPLSDDLVKAYLERGGGIGQESMSNTQSPVSSLQEQQMIRQQPENIQLQNVIPGLKSYNELNALQQLASSIQQGLPASPLVRESLGKAKIQLPQQSISPKERAIEPQQIKTNQPKSFAETLAQPTLKEQRQLDYQQKKLDQAERKLANQEKIQAYKATEKVRSEINKEAKSAKAELKDFNEMQELNESGKLDTPGYVEFLNRSGFDIPALLNPESEAFQKIATNQLRNAKTYFGGKVSNEEMKQFLKAIPQLSNSSEGRKRVIAMLKDQARLKVEYQNAMKDIIKENKGIPPLDLEVQVSDRIDKVQDKLAAKFKKDLARPVPKGQNRIITAAQAAAGGAIGAIPGALKGAAKGALIGAGIGSIGGGIGAAPGSLGGAGLGALGGLLGVF